MDSKLATETVGTFASVLFSLCWGGASIFRSFSQSLPPEIEVWPVQLPGHENRMLEPPYSHMDALIDSLEQALLPYLEVPYAFFGHSMGALVSFELTCSLRRRAQPSAPVRLCVSGHRAPQIPDPNPPVHYLPDSELTEELRCLKGTPEEVLSHPELLQLLLPVLRADFTLCETYVYDHEKPLTCPISAFSGLKDDEVPCELMSAWRDQTYNSFKLRFFNGDHFFIHKEQTSLLLALSQDLLSDLGGL